MEILKGILIFLNIVLILGTVGAYLAPYFPPNEAGIISILGLIFPGLLLGNIVFLLIWLGLNPKWALGSFLTLLLGVPFISKSISFSIYNPTTQDITTLKIGTYNLQFSKPVALKQATGKDKADIAFNAFLKEIDYLDILGVQECGWRSRGHIEESMQFPYAHFIDNIYIGIYSKHPIINKGIVDFGQKINKCLWADITVGSDTIRFYTVHLEPNRFDGKVPLVVDQESREDFNHSKLFGVVRHYNTFSAKRAAQAKLIRAHQRNSPFPCIISGDFNELPQSYTYHTIAEELQDSFVQSGLGIGTTIGGIFPGLRIDYIFADLRFKIWKHQIQKVDFSDHYFVEAEIKL